MGRQDEGIKAKTPLEMGGLLPESMWIPQAVIKNKKARKKMVLTQLSIIIHKWKYCPFSSF